MNIDFDRRMLADSVRNDAYAKALKSVIKKDVSTVTDMGAGTGFLGFLAAKAGAKECLLYEFAPVHTLASELAEVNGLKNCRVIAKHTSQVKKPERTDIVVTETFGNFALEEHLVENLLDARRFVKPGGVVIPFRTEMLVAPVTSKRFYDELTVWDRVGYDLDLSVAKDMSMHNMYVRTIRPDDLWQGMASAKVFDTVEASGELESKRTGEVSWMMPESETIYGFAVWWRSDLVQGVELSTAPDAPATHWEQVYLPALKPFSLEKGETLSISITSDSSYDVGINVSWIITTSGGVRQELDMMKGRVDA